MGMQAMSERKNIVGEIIADARDKLLDEGWFGRRPTEQREDPLARFGGSEDFGQRSPEAFGASSLGWELDAPKARTAEESMALLSFEEAWATRKPPMDKLDPDHDLGIGIDH